MRISGRGFEETFWNNLVFFIVKTDTAHLLTPEQNTLSFLLSAVFPSKIFFTLQHIKLQLNS